MTRLAVVGSRSITDEAQINKVIQALINKYPIDTLVSGGAHGVDSIAKKYATLNKIRCIEFPADWHTHGTRAGFIRNVDIVKNSDIVLAVWDGTSKGTQHSFQLSKEHKKLLVIYYYNEKTVKIHDYRENL